MKRVDIKIGALCNNNCLFCGQAHKKEFGNSTNEEIKLNLKDARKRCTEVVFTGGEPTIRTDLVELVAYAKSLNYKIIQIQTNGRMFAYKKFCRDLINVGANEFALALHGHTPKLHDYLTRSKGSFKQTVQGIKNLKELNQIVITNTVVTKQNYKYCENIAQLLLSLGVDQYQFAMVHPVGNAEDYFDTVVPSMQLAAPYIHKGLDVGIKKKIVCMAEGMPYCLMKGYEKYVSENYIPATEIYDMGGVVDDYAKSRKEMDKTKFSQCTACSYNSKCEGIWKEHLKRISSAVFIPRKDHARH